MGILKLLLIPLAHAQTAPTSGAALAMVNQFQSDGWSVIQPVLPVLFLFAVIIGVIGMAFGFVLARAKFRKH